jgi:VanZ family protein
MPKRFSKERIFYILMTLLIAIVIFLVSSISSFPNLEKTGINISIFYHFGVFFMFTFFLTLSLINGKLDNKTILIILLISLAYALSDEFHQLFVPGRFCSLEDMLIDFAGSICSVLVIKTIEKLKTP